MTSPGTPRFTNRLAGEASPYLIQHAHNPVDWYPWGGEAFLKARHEDKPVFLSIGYSTCHWCHVMEHESFDNEEIAAYLNEHFVSIKLDREQRPDLDDVYMTGVQMMTGQGGWPMSNFLTSEGKPFFAGTYFPPQHFLALLRQITTVWRDRRADVLSQADEIATGIARYTTAKSDAKALPADLSARASAELLGRFDDENGGFGGAPKFPNESMLLVLLEDWQRNGNKASLAALATTLDRMYMGGICDQIAGGFHRYTVDAIWLVPHFEKMLYNQAQLLRLYGRAAASTGSVAWRRVASQLVDYLARDMTAPGGAFYSATDADSEGEEGLFFLWTPDEIRAALPEEDARFVMDIYGVSDGGNFEGRNILYLAKGFEAYAQEYGSGVDALFARLDKVHRRLYEVREGRIHPLRDEKIITAWNGMLISSLAEAGVELQQPEWINAAARAAEFLWQHAFDEKNDTLWRICFNDSPSIPGNLEDYGFYAEALLTLYSVTGNRSWLARGERLVRSMLDQFYDEEAGGFFLAREEDEGPMITRPKSPMDGATASGNSAAIASLVMLHGMTGDRGIEQRINESLGAFAGLLVASPSAFSYMVVAAERYRSGARGVVQFAGDGNVRVVCQRNPKGAAIKVMLADGWHINGEEVIDESLVATSIGVDGVVSWPASTDHRYEGEVMIEISGQFDEIELTLQPCSNELCLAPQVLHFFIGSMDKSFEEPV